MEKKEMQPAVKQPAVKEQEITTQVLEKIKTFTDTGELVLPRNYIVSNALKGAMLVLNDTKNKDGKLAMEICTKNSIANALLKMCVEGLSPLKKQGYFIIYDNELQWLRSYQGAIALAKRVGGVLNVVANVIYEKDIFEYSIDCETGFKKIINHEQKLANIDNSKIKGAYAMVIYDDGNKDLEVMTIAEIKVAWNQGAMNGNSNAHENFTQEMCKKTVINRACKMPINSSNDFHIPEQQKIENDDVEDIKHEIISETATEILEFKEAKNNEPKNVEKPEKKQSTKLSF